MANQAHTRSACVTADHAILYITLLIHDLMTLHGEYQRGASSFGNPFARDDFRASAQQDCGDYSLIFILLNEAPLLSTASSPRCRFYRRRQDLVNHGQNAWN